MKRTKAPLILAAAALMALSTAGISPVWSATQAEMADALARLNLARQAVKQDPPRDALFNSTLADHPMFNQVFASLDESKLNEAAATLMAEQFSAAELKALVDFQNSPEGKTIRMKMPAYQKLLGATMQNYLSVAFQQMMLKQGQGGASGLPSSLGATGRGATSSSLPPMTLPQLDPAKPAAAPAAMPSGAGTPLKK